MRQATDDSDIDAVQIRKREVKVRSGHLRGQRVGRVELDIDSLVDLGLPFLVAGEGHGASLGDAGDRVDDASRSAGNPLTDCAVMEIPPSRRVSGTPLAATLK